MGDQPKLYSIQMLRFVAATLVVLFHAHLGVSTRLMPEKADPQQLYLFGFGAVGVSIFFVISGYIMVHTNARTDRSFDVWQFLIRRMIRIYPVYWILAALYLAVNSGLGTSYDLTVAKLVSAFLLMPSEAALFIGPAWTLSYELYFYLIFGIAMLFGLWRALLLMTLFFGLSMAIGIINKPDDATLLVMTSSHLIEFLFGIWIAYVLRAQRPPRRVGTAALGTALLLFAFGLTWGYDRLPAAAIWGLPSALLVFGSVVMERHHCPSWLRKIAILGDSSYALYLIHILIIIVLTWAVKLVGWADGPVLFWTVIFSGVGIAAAHIFHLAVEAPVTAFLKRRVRGRR